MERKLMNIRRSRKVYMQLYRESLDTSYELDDRIRFLRLALVVKSNPKLIGVSEEDLEIINAIDDNLRSGFYKYEKLQNNNKGKRAIWKQNNKSRV